MRKMVNPKGKDKCFYNTFISYSHREPDKSWVRNKLLPALEQAGLSVCIDFKSFQPGKLLIKEIERSVEQSNYTLAVLSSNYLSSSFAELENILAEHLGLEEDNTRLLIVMIENCEPRLGIQARIWLDMTNEAKFNENLERLIEILSPPL